MTQVAVVTGTSSGIGLATARRLTAAGWRVLGADREPGELTTTILDVRDEDAVNALVAGADRLDAVVANAAYGLGGAIEEATVDEGKEVLDVNFFGAVRLARAALPRFRAQGHGRLVIVSSGAGFTAEPFAGYYTASKFALEGLAETLWHELRPFAKISVSLVEPGWTRTNIVARSLFTASRVSAYDPAREACFGAATDYCNGGIDPDRVAARIERALTDRRPRLRYRVGPDVTRSFWVRWLLPERVFLSLVHRYYRLGP